MVGTQEMQNYGVNEYSPRNPGQQPSDGQQTPQRQQFSLKNSLEWNLFSEVWTLFKKYYRVRSDDAFWSSLVDESDYVFKKYEQTECKGLAESLILAVVKELEKKEMQVRHGNLP